jgi:hypothetical protein
MISETGDPECLPRQPIILHALSAPRCTRRFSRRLTTRRAQGPTKPLGHATIHAAVTGAAMAGRTPNAVAVK